MPVRFNNVSENIFRGGQPSPTDLQILSDVYGVKRIVSLDGSIGNNIAPVVRSLGMEHIVIPIGGQESSPLIGFLKENIATLLDIQPVYIHCRHGSDRTGMAIAMFRVQCEGWSPDDAMDEAKTYNFGDKLDADTESLYKSALMGNDVNDNYDDSYRGTSHHSAHDDLMAAPYQKPSNIMGDDIVDTMRDWFNFGDVPMAFMPQQSFSPKEDVKFAPPREPINDAPPGFRDPWAFTGIHPHLPSIEEKRRRAELRKIILTETMPKDVPATGISDNYDGIRGAGPMAGDSSSGGGGFAHSERGSTPGVGASETGGLLNL